jgi:hypothetical protein
MFKSCPHQGFCILQMGAALALLIANVMPTRADVRYFSAGGTGYIELTDPEYGLWKAGRFSRADVCLRLPTGEGDCNCPRPDGPGFGSGDSPAERKLVLISRREACPVPCTSAEGQWTWPARYGSAVITLRAGGTGDNGRGATVSWSQSGSTATLVWRSYGTTDTLTLEAGGTRLRGTFGAGSAGTAVDVATRASTCF